MQLVAHVLCQALLVYELDSDFFPGLFVKLVDRGADRLKLTLFTTSELNHSVKELSMVQLELEITDFKTCQYFTDDSEHLSIWQHKGVGSGDVEVTLVEFTVATFRHLGLIPSVHFSNVESFY